MLIGHLAFKKKKKGKEYISHKIQSHKDSANSRNDLHFASSRLSPLGKVFVNVSLLTR